MRSNSTPRNLREAVRYFSDPGRCLEFAVSLRWPDGVVCPVCGGADVTFLSTRRIWKCRSAHPRRQFSVKSGTIFEDSPIGLDKWFEAIWMVANGADDLSSYTVARELGVTQKTAWFMMHRIRIAMRSGSFEKAVLRDDPVSIASRAGSLDPEGDRR